jgi:hypothetical protein
MTRRAALRLTLAFAAIVLLTTVVSAIPRTFVSRAGNNANACTEAAPCRTFAVALTKTDAKGEIIVLDSGAYGPISIDKAVRITAVGVYAGIEGTSATGENAVHIDAAPTDIVVLRGLTISGRGAKNGIHGSVIKALHIEDCTISGFTTTGILFTASGALFVKDTAIRNNGSYGIRVAPAGVYTPTASIDHCRLEKHSFGVALHTDGANGAKVTVRGSVAAGNGSVGYLASGANAQLNVFDSEAVHGTGAGFMAQVGARLNAQHCLSASNSSGFVAQSGAVLSAKDCTAANNTFNGMQSAQDSTKLRVEGCQLVNNSGHGLWVVNGATALISDTMVTGNDNGLRNEPANPGTLQTFGNNRVDGNTTNAVGTITAVAQM